MAEIQTKKGNGPEKVIDEEGREVIDPRKALAEQTLAVDLARVEIDQAIATAHKFPRHIDTVIKKIGTLALYNREAAENCVYALPRAGKPIIGPSIGFATIVHQSWGNCRVRAAITYVDRREKTVIAAGQFFDLETNAETIVPVTRRIVDSKGRLYSDDMIQVTGMAAASIAARNAILRGVSRGIWHPIWLDALGIVRGDTQTFAENKAKAITAMAQFGVKPEQLFQYLGLKGEVELTLEHIPTLRGMYAALRDGNVSVEEMFDPRRMTGRGGWETVENPLGEDDDAPPPAAGPTVTVHDNETGEAVQVQAPPAPQPAAAPATPTTQGALGLENAQAGPATSAAALPAETPEAFLSYWADFCAEATSAVALVERWDADRELRRRCRITGGRATKARELKEAREAELRR